jgi:hypothetical protein
LPLGRHKEIGGVREHPRRAVWVAGWLRLAFSELGGGRHGKAAGERVDETCGFVVGVIVAHGLISASWE